MNLEIKKEKTLRELQEDFGKIYPYLRLDFQTRRAGMIPGDQLTLRAAGMKTENGAIVLDETMTVDELTAIFFSRFGLQVRISRKSGPVWLSTSITNSWTLGKQNEHGEALSA